MQKTLDNTFNLTGLGRIELDTYLDMVSLSELSNSSQVWQIQESSHQLGYLTHNFFRFFGKFPPPIAEKFITELHNPDSGPILDPMMGSGTTLVEALRLNRCAYGIDVNPLFRLVAKTKTTYIEPNAILKTISKLDDFQDVDPHILFDYIPKDRYIDHWFFKETQLELAKIRYFIESQSLEDQESVDIVTYLKVGFASIIRKTSRASKNLGRMFLDPNLTPINVFDTYLKKINKMNRRINQLKKYPVKPIVLENNDAKNTGLINDSIGLVICHPPYYNLYKYSSIYKFEMLWLGYDPKYIRKVEIKEGFKKGNKKELITYINAMSDILDEINRVLLTNACCVLMIGDAYIKDEIVPITSLLLDSISNYNYEVSNIIVRIPKYTEASYAATQRRRKQKVGIKLPDHLVVLKKT